MHSWNDVSGLGFRAADHARLAAVTYSREGDLRAARICARTALRLRLAACAAERIAREHRGTPWR